MDLFRWIGSGEIRSGVDLRDCGWTLLPEDEAQAAMPCPVLTDSHASQRMMEEVGAACRAFPPEPYNPAERSRLLVIGVNDSALRASLMALGVGDVIDDRATLAETQARASRIAQRLGLVSRYREHGSIRLDLFCREAYAGETALGLHPREFELLWRLMESPGTPVDKASLMRDVWHLAFVPETNRVAVHASRLRTKLALVGLAEFVQTTPGGAYFVAPVSAMPMRRMRPRRRAPAEADSQ